MEPRLFFILVARMITEKEWSASNPFCWENFPDRRIQIHHAMDREKNRALWPWQCHPERVRGRDLWSFGGAWGRSLVGCKAEKLEVVFFFFWKKRFGLSKLVDRLLDVISSLLVLMLLHYLTNVTWISFFLKIEGLYRYGDSPIPSF